MSDYRIASVVALKSNSSSTVLPAATLIVRSFWTLRPLTVVLTKTV
jgi:hypothetical protein